jgi:hypothetical protein
LFSCFFVSITRMGALECRNFVWFVAVSIKPCVQYITHAYQIYLLRGQIYKGFWEYSLPSWKHED